MKTIKNNISKPKDACKVCNFKWNVCPYYKSGICSSLNNKK